MKRSLYILTVIILLLAGSTAVILFARGFSLNFEQKTLEKTGTILVKSSPDGAKILLDEEFVAVTNNQLPRLKSGNYRLKVVKEGFFDWEKTVEVKNELVTEVYALLIPRSPALSPLTASGVEQPTLSANRDRIAFLKQGEKSGLYTLPLSGGTFLGILRANITPVLLDGANVRYSRAEKILWAPDDSEMLIQMNPAGFYRLKLTGGQATPEATSSSQGVFADWQTLAIERNRLLSARIKVPEYLKDVAAAPTTPWSPDEKKFLFKRTRDEGMEYWVFDGTEPLGVGLKRENMVLRTTNPDEVRLFWFSDSQHLILVDQPKDRGRTINLVEIDGTNKTPVYSGSLAAGTVFPTPDGARLIILTNLIEDTEPNLYAINLR